MCFHEDRSAGCLVHAAGFHTDNAVLDDVNDTDTVCASELVQLADHVGRFHGLAVDGCRNTLFKCHCDFRFTVRCMLRRDGHDEHVVIIRSERRIFKLKTFMADVPEVAVTAVALGMIERKVNAVCLAVFDFIFPRLECPEVCHTPGSDDFDIRSESLDAQFKTDLIITLAGSTVADRYSALLAGDFDEFLYDSRAGHGSSEQVLVLIDSACLYARHNEILCEIVVNILNV